MSKRGRANLKLRSALVRLEVQRAWYGYAGQSKRLKALVKTVEDALGALYREVDNVQGQAKQGKET